MTELEKLREAVRKTEIQERSAWRALQAAKDAHEAARKACIAADRALIQAETKVALDAQRKARGDAP